MVQDHLEVVSAVCLFPTEQDLDGLLADIALQNFWDQLASDIQALDCDLGSEPF